MSGSGMFGLGELSGVGRLGWLAGGIAIATAGFVAYRAMPLYNAGATRSVSAEGQNATTTTVATFSDAVKRDAGMVDGRSLFYIPSPPPPPPPPPRPEEPYVPPPPTPAPKPPAVYGGPKIIGAAIDTVWFDNGKRLTAGGDADGDLRVIEITEVPWAARLEWKGVEFDVPFITRDGVVIKDEKAPPVGSSGVASTPEPAPAPAAPAAVPGAEAKKDDAKKDDTKKDEPKKEEKKEEKPEGGATPIAPPPPDKK